MSGGVVTDSPEEVGLLPPDQTEEPQKAADKKLIDRDSLEEEEEEEEEAVSSALLEPATLPWPGDKDKRPVTDTGEEEVWSDKGAASEVEERDTGISGGSQDLSEEHSQPEADPKDKAKWRESMPEGERWRDDDEEVQGRRDDHGSFADDEEEEEEEEEKEEEEEEWISGKAGLGFTPNVTIVRRPSKESAEQPELHPQMEPDSAVQIYPVWADEDDKIYLCDSLCSQKMRLVLATLAAGLVFPLLVWGGYALLPFDSPLLESVPLRVMYTLRCSFFAIIPILLGVVVQGVARLRHGALTPLYRDGAMHREVAVHWHYVNESLALFLFYFLQLAVMATYVEQDLVKLVPLLTIVFVFGRLIYWLCLSLGSTFRGFGFGLSFLPVLVMLGVNFYFVFSSVGRESIFEVAPPTTAPPARPRWWG